MSRFVVALALGTLVTTAAFAEEPESTSAPSITPTELQSKRESGDAPVVIDVRTPEEFALGHIPGALNIAFDEVAERISQVEAPNGVALYCMVGPRARKGEAALLAAGYKNAFHIEGGLAAWKASGLPVQKNPAEPPE